MLLDFTTHTLGAQKHGLTFTGIGQAKRSADCVLRVIGLENLDRVIFLSSYYKRARETAFECMDELCRHFHKELLPYQNGSSLPLNETTIASLKRSQTLLEYLACSSVIPKDDLRERYFGKLDGTVLINYNKVWPIDMVIMSS